MKIIKYDDRHDHKLNEEFIGKEKDLAIAKSYLYFSLISYIT